MPGDPADLPRPFQIDRAEAPAGVVVLVVSGELDLACSGRFRAHCDEAVAAGPRMLIADLTDVTFMESTMLRELLRAREALEQAGARLIVVGVNEQVRRLLELTGTIGMFSLAETRAQALEASAG